MRIRKRLSLLFICGALLPLVVLTSLHYISMHRLGSELARTTQETLTARERNFLLKTIKDYTQVLQLKRQALETALHLQAREVERLLASGTASEFSEQGPGLARSSTSRMHFQRKNLHDLEPLQVNYEQPAIYIAPRLQKNEIIPDKPLLSGLKDSFWFIKQCHQELIYWQHITLESGLQIWYPGHSQFPEFYEPLEQSWYQKAKQSRELIWQVEKEPVTQRVMQVVAQPVYFQDGSFSGVTAIHVCLENIFQELQLPKAWEEQAEAALVFFEARDGVQAEALEILAYERFDKYSSMVRGEPDRREKYLDWADSNKAQKLFQEIAKGYPGVIQLENKNREVLYAYGAHEQGQPFPLLMLPYEQIATQASMVQNQVQEKTQKWLKLAAGSLLGALVLSTLLALFSARTVIRPVMKLARTANALANGDFSSQVNISSGDELQELGNIFNDMSWRLQENERMRHALAVARETQQYLLPKQAPEIKNYDISGRSVYSDETGGDYYDFIELMDSGQEKLGIAVGDVSGHGIGAALLMASARGVIRSHAAKFSSDLGNLFYMLNEHLIRDTGEARFLTLFYAILDSQSNTLTWNSAGHEPGLLLNKKTGNIIELASTGMPLGISQDARHVQADPVQLEAGDLVLIGTDGIREARNEDREIFGRERVVEILRTHAQESTQIILDRIVQSLQEFRGNSSQEDDVTLVAIKYQSEDS